MTLVKLHSAGISDSEIAELIGFVNQWGRNGINNSNGSISSSSGKPNEFKFELDDRLNV